MGDLSNDTGKADPSKMIPAEGLKTKSHGPSAMHPVDKKQDDILETKINESSQYPKLDWGPNIP